MRDRVIMCSKHHLIFCLLFIWLSSTTTRPPHQLGVLGARELRAVARREIQGQLLEFSISNPRGWCDPSIYMRRLIHEVVMGTTHPLLLIFLRDAASLSYRPFVCHAADQGKAVPPNRRWQFNDLHGCQRIGFAPRTFARVPLHHSLKAL
jgi:hypothetical protein